MTATARFTMTTNERKIAVVTGAASGIGRALAIRFGRAGYGGVAITDVNELGLSETADEIERLGVAVLAQKADVSDRVQVDELRDRTLERFGRVSHLVNNAGVGLIGRFDQLSIDDFEWLMGINFWGVVNGCKAFLPTLLDQPESAIVNISSVFGLIAPEEQSAYSASKFAVRGFTESLRHELEGTSVFVTCVHPGGIRTNIVRNSRVGKDAPDEWKQQGTRLFEKVAKTSSEEAANVIFEGIAKRDTRILIGKDARSISHISRMFPKRYLRIIERLNGHKMSLRKK